MPVTIDGAPVKLATITYKPAGSGPFPTLIFHHGSTGRGTDPAAFARPYNPTTMVQWFTDRGWAVILPSRRGRGGSEGLYDEGFSINRSLGYSCEETLALPAHCATSTRSHQSCSRSPSSTAAASRSAASRVAAS